MALAASESLTNGDHPNTTAQPRTGVYWTQFPAASLSDVNWTDHRAAHRGVMRLFPRLLEGPADHRRAAAGIMYRLDVLGGVPTVLVQSLVRPELTPESSRTTEVSARAWTAEAGERVVFRIAVNPVRRSTQQFSDATKTVRLAPLDGTRRTRSHQKQVAAVVPVEGITEWLSARLDGALGELVLVNHFRDLTATGGHKLVVDTIDAVAVVTDAAALDEVRRKGVGRSKAYGCGLLTLRRVSR